MLPSRIALKRENVPEKNKTEGGRPAFADLSLRVQTARNSFHLSV